MVGFPLVLLLFSALASIFAVFSMVFAAFSVFSGFRDPGARLEPYISGPPRDSPVAPGSRKPEKPEKAAKTIEKTAKMEARVAKSNKTNEKAMFHEEMCDFL